MTLATFDHGRKQWCVQLLELGPSPVLTYCEDEQSACKLSDDINKNRISPIKLGEKVMADLASQYPATVLHIEPFVAGKRSSNGLNGRC